MTTTNRQNGAVGAPAIPISEFKRVFGQVNMPQELQDEIYKHALTYKHTIRISTDVNGQTLLQPLPPLAAASVELRKFYLSTNVFEIPATLARHERSFRQWITQIGGCHWLAMVKTLDFVGEAFDHHGEVSVAFRVNFPHPFKMPEPSFSCHKLRRAFPDYALYNFSLRLGFPLPAGYHRHHKTAKALAAKMFRDRITHSWKTHGQITDGVLASCISRIRIILEGLDPVIVRVGNGDFAVPAAWAKKMRLV